MKTTLAKSLGGDLRKLRLDAGLTQRELAKATGLTHVYVSYVENGRREPRIGTITKWADACGMTAHIVFARKTSQAIYLDPDDDSNNPLIQCPVCGQVTTAANYDAGGADPGCLICNQCNTEILR